jgi:hypothetical protein
LVHIIDLLNKQIYNIPWPMYLKPMMRIHFTIWKKFSDLIIQPGDVMAIKYVKIGEYNLIYISRVDNRKIVIDYPYRLEAEVRYYR